MRSFQRLMCLAAIALVASPGCAALSLFSTTHEHHYESSPSVERRLDDLEQRVNALDQGHLSASMSSKSSAIESGPKIWPGASPESE